MRLFTALLLVLLAWGNSYAQSGYKLETIAEGLNLPWSIAFLPNVSYLVAMRSGNMLSITADGQASEPLSDLPDSYVMSQGGYLFYRLTGGANAARD